MVRLRVVLLLNYLSPRVHRPVHVLSEPTTLATARMCSTWGMLTATASWTLLWRIVPQVTLVLRQGMAPAVFSHLYTHASRFCAPVSYSVGSLPIFVRWGDINGDGKLDLATVNESSNNVSVLLNTGTGT